MPLNIVRQDITNMKVDAVVNTTNEEMKGYSGVDAAIHKKAGVKLEYACSHIAPLGLGEAKLTPGFDLPAKYIIHTRGPIWEGGLKGEKAILSACYTESLELAVKQNLNSVAFPLISSGAYGYPKDQVLKLAVQVISKFLYHNELTVYLCIYDRTSYEFSKTRFSELSEYMRGDEYADICYSGAAACAPAPCCSSDNMQASRMNSEGAKATKLRKLFAKEKKTDSTADLSLYEYMQNMDKAFAYKLFDYIDSRGMTDVECYKKANVDKKTFSKIKCNPDTYKPSKQTAVAFAIALRLNIDETQDLLASAGLALSRSFTFDKIIRYFIQKEIYDIFEINEALFEFDQVLLGCSNGDY